MTEQHFRFLLSSYWQYTLFFYKYLSLQKREAEKPPKFKNMQRIYLREG